MELPKTIDSLLKLIAKKDEGWANLCKNRVVRMFAPEDENYWFDASAWLKHALKAFNCKLAVKEKYGLDVDLNVEDLNLKKQFSRVLDQLLAKRIEADMPVLAQKYSQLKYVDEFGELECKKWLEYFSTCYVEGKLSKIVIEYMDFVSQFYEPAWLLEKNYNDIAHEKFLNGLSALGDDFFETLNESNQLDPYQFEKLCSDILSKAGWKSRTTKGSGDQGVDVIAEKCNVKLAIQCKLYSNDVTNKAVQEVFAGSRFYQCNAAIVVTNSDFSVSARQLANSTNVYLVTVDQLETLANRIYQTMIVE